MGLQTDAEGNFYYAKAARHGLTAVVPQHGTLLQRQQGRRADRDPGHRLPRPERRLPQPRRHLLPHRPGRVLDPQEPDQLGQAGRLLRQHVGLSRRHRPVRRGDGAAGLLDHQRLRPLAGRAGPGRERPAWGPLEGSLLNLSYGYGKVFVVPHETVGGRMQGGMCALPIPQFPTGVMRGRFHPGDGQLYACGLFAWAGDRTQPGGFYRIRATGKPMYVPVGLHARKDGMAITFTDPLDRKAAARPDELRGQDVVAEADGQLRLRPHRRAAGPDRRRRSSPTTAAPSSSRSPRSGRPGAWRSPTRSAASRASPSRARSTTRSTSWAIEATDGTEPRA